jgi:hypothetical protein
VQKNGRLNSGSGERNGSPWPPWRLPTPCDDKYADPRLLLHSRYAHGLIFNLLYKAVYQEVSSDNITSLTLFLLELALSLPQTDFSGKVNIFSNFASERFWVEIVRYPVPVPLYNPCREVKSKPCPLNNVYWSPGIVWECN